ncbi:hypothetical protein [Leucobacter sp. OH1287]|uniref:hypothetical protein n=1 Tax=Leucobacter sp. OH1287 TaxID=2491049 RepID=UPI000F5DE55E|nr:hypothetical protein [Leucobacter sp. OH1287]RRD59538.1 hypothetical protein EII30_08620 [Leucobacter sp. OH1287]
MNTTTWAVPTIADLKARNAELVGMVDTAELALEKLHIAHHKTLTENQTLRTLITTLAAELAAEKIAHLDTLEALYYSEQTA